MNTNINRILFISKNDPNEIITYSAALCAFCNAIEPHTLPQEFLLYPSYCYQGWVWTSVNEGRMLLFVVFNGENIVALSTLHWKDGGWESGFTVSLPQYNEEHNQATLARYDFLQTAANNASYQIDINLSL